MEDLKKIILEDIKQAYKRQARYKVGSDHYYRNDLVALTLKKVLNDAKELNLITKTH